MTKEQAVSEVYELMKKYEKENRFANMKAVKNDFHAGEEKAYGAVYNDLRDLIFRMGE